MNCRPSPIPSPAALHASRALPEPEAAPLIRLQPAIEQFLVRVSHLSHTELANLTDQPLSQNAIQRRHKVIRLNTHVQEAPQHIDNVVRVNRSKHQMPSQR